MIDKVKERLISFGYTMQNGDEIGLSFAISKVESTIKNDCNISEIPDGLERIAIDMSVGEFLLAKKTFAVNDIAGLDLDTVVKQIQTGDTNVTFAIGDGNHTPEQRLDVLINYLLTYGREQFSAYRRIRW